MRYTIHVRIPVDNADDDSIMRVADELLTSGRGGEIGLVASDVFVTDDRGEVVGQWKAPREQTPVDYLREALRADVVIPVGRPGALSVPELLGLRGWFDERQAALREERQPEG